MKKFHCCACGEIDHVVLDGYHFGDRQLEDVMFEARQDDQGKWQVNVEKDAADYFAQFNADFWFNKMISSLETDEYAACPKCGEDIEINPPRPRSAPQPLKMSRFSDILGSLAGAVVSQDEDSKWHGTNTGQEEDEKEEESSSLGDGDTGGGGMSGDLDEKEDPEPEPEPDEPEESDDSSDDSSSDES